MEKGGCWTTSADSEMGLRAVITSCKLPPSPTLTLIQPSSGTHGGELHSEDSEATRVSVTGEWQAEGVGEGPRAHGHGARVGTGAKTVLTEHLGYGERSRRQEIARKGQGLKGHIIRPSVRTHGVEQRCTAAAELRGTAPAENKAQSKMDKTKHPLHLWRHRMADKHLEQRPRIQSHPGTVNLEQDSTIHLLKWPKSKTLPTPNAAEYGSGRDFLITGGSAKEQSHAGGLGQFSTKPSILFPHDPGTMLFGET